MKLFLDTSVLLSASNSTSGASRAIFALAERNQWEIQARPWVVAELSRNLAKFPAQATDAWLELREQLSLVDDVVSLKSSARLPGEERPPRVGHCIGILGRSPDFGPGGFYGGAW